MSGVRSITKKQLSVLTTTLSMSSINSSIILGLLGTYPYHTFAALFFSFVLFRRLNKGTDHNNPNGLPLAPGPKGYPLIGNLFDMPAQSSWIVYDEWRKTYGKSFTFSGLSPKITEHFRWYDIPQCSWPTLCNFKFLGSHLRPVWEKVYNLLRQNADDYVNWSVCITFFLPQLQRIRPKCRSLQNELAHKPSPYPIRIVVAKTQKIISRVFPP